MELTQKSYDLCMDYVGMNMACAVQFAPLPYTGLVRWHERNHEVYDEFNKKITKYVGNVYGELPKYSAPSTYNYSLPGSMIEHIDYWTSYLTNLKLASHEMYEEAKKTAHDFLLADMFICMNKTVANEILYLTRLKRRIAKMPESELLLVNKILHDYFEKNPDCKELDFSL